MAKEGGKKVKVNKSLSTKAIMLMIRKKALESSDGQVEMFMKEASKEMKEMVMAK